MVRCWVATLALAATLAGPRRASAETELGIDLELSEAEAAYCASELTVLQNRQRVFAGQGLSRAEQRRRNGPAEAELAECRARYQDAQRSARDDAAVRAEVARRMPPGAGEVQWAALERQVRLERARTKPASELTRADGRLLAEYEAGRRNRAAPERPADPRALQLTRSAALCREEERLERARAELADEERLSALEGGGSNRRYYLQAETRRLGRNVSALREELAEAGGPVPCNDPQLGCAAEGRPCPVEEPRAGVHASR